MVRRRQPGSVRKERLVNLLREKGYKFKRQADRVELWRASNGTNRAAVPRRDWLEEFTVLSILRQCGLDEDEIQAFLHENSD